MLTFVASSMLWLLSSSSSLSLNFCFACRARQRAISDRHGNVRICVARWLRCALRPAANAFRSRSVIAKALNSPQLTHFVASRVRDLPRAPSNAEMLLNKVALIQSPPKTNRSSFIFGALCLALAAAIAATVDGDRSLIAFIAV